MVNVSVETGGGGGRNGDVEHSISPRAWRCPQKQQINIFTSQRLVYYTLEWRTLLCDQIKTKLSLWETHRSSKFGMTRRISPVVNWIALEALAYVVISSQSKREREGCRCPNNLWWYFMRIGNSSARTRCPGLHMTRTVLVRTSQVITASMNEHQRSSCPVLYFPPSFILRKTQCVMIKNHQHGAWNGIRLNP